MHALPRLLLLAFFTLGSQAWSQQKPKVNETNTDDMWVAKVAPNAMAQHLTHHTYRSEAMNREVGYSLYLPPGYEKNPTVRYPVIYHLHGAGGNELRAVASAQVLQQGIVSGHVPEMIMVFPNGGRSTMYQDSADGKFLAETTLIKELIPHIDTTYRTIAERKGRCIEGFSMGGRGAVSLALKHPDLFCSLFDQSGNVDPVSSMPKDVPATAYPFAYLGNDLAKLQDNDPYVNLHKNLEAIKGGLRIMLACGTHDPDHLMTVRAFHEALVKTGVDHTYMELEGLGHNQSQMIALLKPLWFDYHTESLKRAGAELHLFKK
ncbi:MAG: putative esterase [Verrucomicrobiaceae bacterium]|nr:putative esterase [Verrucomicrobiaceae bacterium]